MKTIQMSKTPKTLAEPLISDNGLRIDIFKLQAILRSVYDVHNMDKKW